MHCDAVWILLSVFCGFVAQTGAQIWRGNFARYYVRRSNEQSYCICWYRRWGCAAERWRTVYWDELVERCQYGWTDQNGDRNCNVPVCNPQCANGGTCINPNTCKCTSLGFGPTCRTLTCSYQRPCYPGDCVDSTTCSCTPGFTAINVADGCINFAKNETRLKPSFGESNVTISDIRRLDNTTTYMFVLDVGDVNSTIVWSNQQRFNHLKFEVRAVFDVIENLPNRPVYVYDSKIGIVENIVTTNHSKISRSGSPIRDPGSFNVYPCVGSFSKDNPSTAVASCIVNDDQFKTYIEHGDWLNIEFRSLSGGFQKIVNIDQQSSLLPTKYYNGLTVTKTVEFRFDFIAPKHCSELGEQNCGKMLEILHVYTRDPIRAQWLGWTDELSGVGEYYMEVFKLEPNRDGRLVETTPINPVFATTVAHSASGIQYPPGFRPSEAGMYSVLLEVRDNSNNSRIARRFVLYDATSTIYLNNETAKLYVSSAIEETGYTWQTPAKTGQNVTVTVAWPNYFVNKLHESNQFLAEIERYPIQFKDIQDDGVLNSEKFVADALDDNEDPRTRKAIPNFHGIIKFEIFWQWTIDLKEPDWGWQEIPLKESFTSQRPLVDRDRLRVWVRATDIMGNQRADSTIILMDGSRPLIQTDPSKTEQNLNVANGPYNYSSKVVFHASDGDSGVYKIGFDIFVQTDPKNPLTQKMVYSNFTAGNIGSRDNAECRDVGAVCFLSSQTVYLDNCWMLVGKSELDTAVAMLNVTAYNQAMLGTSATINLGPVNKLQGLEKYDGPQNPRIVNKTPTGFRITWDLPEKKSCYGRADIVIILSRKTATGADVLHTYYTPGTSNHFDILGLNPETEYTLGLNIQTPGTLEQQTDFLINKTDCGYLLPILNGQISLLQQGNTTYGAGATVMCSIGYNSNSSRITCMADGQWEHASCEKIDCGPLQNPTKGKVDMTKGSTYQAVARHTCNQGYELIGDEKRMCQSTGTWSGIQPSCISKEQMKVVCQTNVDIRGTEWKEVIQGSTRVQQCSEGFEGNITRTCLNDGSWQLPQYNCVRKTVTNVAEKVETFVNNATADTVSNALEQIANVTGNAKTTNTSELLTDAEITVLASSLEKVADIVVNKSLPTENVVKAFFQSVSNLVDERNKESWETMKQSKSTGGENMLASVDKIGVALRKKVESGEEGFTNITIVQKNVALEVKKLKKQDIVFPYADIKTDQHEDHIWAKTFESSIRLNAKAMGDTEVIVTVVIYKDMSHVLPNTSETHLGSKTNDQQINGPILSLSLSNNFGKLDPPVLLTFERMKANFTNPVCSYWTFGRNNETGYWASDGCVLQMSDETKTVCQCDHLTNFAVLMSPFVEADVTSVPLRTVSTVGMGISMACLIITIVTYIYLWRFLKSDRAILLLNLCGALLLSYIIFLAGVDKTANKVLCTTTAMFLHYIYLVVFCLMLAEGIDIAIMVVYVFITKSRLKPLLISAWVAPAVIVAISLLSTQANGYGNERFCWLSLERGLIWAFVAPALLIILLNIVCLVLVLMNMFHMKAMDRKTSMEKIKTSLRSLCVLVPLMGVSWILGIFYVNETSAFMQYLFALFNTLQGLFIFIFHCIFNQQVRTAVRNVYNKHENLKSIERSTSRKTSKYNKSLKSSMNTHSENLSSTSQNEVSEDNTEGPRMNFYSRLREQIVSKKKTSLTDKKCEDPIHFSSDSPLGSTNRLSRMERSHSTKSANMTVTAM